MFALQHRKVKVKINPKQTWSWDFILHNSEQTTANCVLSKISHTFQAQVLQKSKFFPAICGHMQASRPANKSKIILIININWVHFNAWILGPNLSQCLCAQSRLIIVKHNSVTIPEENKENRKRVPCSTLDYLMCSFYTAMHTICKI